MASICVAIGGPGLPYVMVDDRLLVTARVEHWFVGHRQFGYISGPAGNLNEIGRYAGFRAGLDAAGLDPAEALYWQGDFSLVGGVQAGRDFLSGRTVQPPSTRRATAWRSAS